MSISQSLSATADVFTATTPEQLKAANDRVLQQMQHDLDLIKRRLKNPHDLVARFTSFKGQYDKSEKTLAYTLFQSLSRTYDSGSTGADNAQSVSIQKMNEYMRIKQDTTLDPLHDLCKRADIDVCLAMSVKRSEIAPAYKRRYQTVLKTTISLEKPYSLSPYKPAPPLPAAPAVVAAPVQEPADAAPHPQPEPAKETVFTTPKIDTGIKAAQGK